MLNKPVLVIGGNGFVGSHLCEKLISQGKKVVAFDRVPINESNNLALIKDDPDFKYFCGDIRDVDDLNNILNQEYDKIFLLSAIVGVKNYCKDPLEVIDVNVIGAYNIIKYALRTKTKIIFTSTSEVYGKNPKVPWSENDDRVLGSTSTERWSYSTSKSICEHMLLGLNKNSGLPVTIVRYFNVYGPRQNPYYIISQTIYKILRNEKPILYDSGSQTRCFTYIDDAIEGTLRASDEANCDGQIFNIGNSTENTVKEAIELSIEISKKGLKWEKFDTKKYYGTTYEDIQRRIPDVSKAKKFLGWEATTKLEDGIKKTIDWSMENQWWLSN